jgi:hypothetical protein
MKKLVAGGCSFTCHDTKPNIVDMALSKEDLDFPRWPVHVARHLNLEPVNLGASGYSNSTISLFVYNHIQRFNKDIDHVCILWSDWFRLNPYDSDLCLHPVNSYVPAYAKNPERDLILKELLLDGPSGCFGQSFIDRVVQHNMRAFFCVEAICKQFNISYTFMQGVPKFAIVQDWFDDFKINQYQIFDSIIKHENWFDHESWIGWPFYQTFNMDQPLTEYDLHPNEKGHELISKQFISFISSKTSPVTTS